MLWNNGDGTFSDPDLVPVGDGPIALTVADLDGEGTMDLAVMNNLAGNVEILINQFVTHVEDGGTDGLPQVYALRQNYPNPFNPATTISYSVPIRSQVTISVFNILGQQVAILVDDVQNAGNYTVAWDGRTSDGTSAATGIYFHRINAGDFIQSKKMLLLK